MGNKTKATAVGGLLQIPFVARGVIGAIGDLQVVRDIMSPGTQENAVLVWFLGTPWAAWILLSAVGAALIAWSLDWWPFRKGAGRTEESPAPVPLPSPPEPPSFVRAEGISGTLIVRDNTVNYGPVTHRHEAPRPRVAPPRFFEKAFAGNGGVAVALSLCTQSGEATRFVTDLKNQLAGMGRPSGLNTLSNGLGPVGVRVRATEHPEAQEMARKMVSLFQEAGIEAHLGDRFEATPQPFLSIEVGDNA